LRPLSIFEATIGLWQKAPSSWRKGLVGSHSAPVLRRIFNAVYPHEPREFTLAEPLAGHRMRLHWQSHKAFVFGTYEPEVVRAIRESVRPGQTVVDVGSAYRVLHTPARKTGRRAGEGDCLRALA
jgi:hypothetical protein